MCRQDKMRIVPKTRPAACCALAMELLLLSACDTKDSATFTVKAEGLPASARAELELCGRTVPMTPLNDAFVASESITCEGEALVRLSFTDGSQLNCDAGYVTRGLNNLGTYEVTVVDQKCSLRALPAQRQD